MKNEGVCAKVAFGCL